MTSYESFLKHLVDELFDDAARQNMTWDRFAEAAGTSKSTVYRLGSRITRFPRIDTIYKLSKAVGKDVKIIKRRFKHYVRAA